MCSRKHAAPWLWSILYGLPTGVFLVLSLITLGNAVVSVDFTMPPSLVVTRALAGYMFAFTSLLYTQLGVPQEKDRMIQKDAEIAVLQKRSEAELADFIRGSDLKIASLTHETNLKITGLAEENRRLAAVIENQTSDLERQKKQQSELENALNESNKSALDAYSDECINWLMSGAKTVIVEEITRFTGHSKRRLNNAIEGGKIQVSPRNKSLILVSSLIEWLEQNPPMTARTEQETGPMLRIVNE